MQYVAKLFFFNILLAWLGQPAQAQDFFIMVGTGTSQCGELLEELESSDKVYNKFMYTHWMQGYLSARNLGKDINLAGFEGQFRWLKNYCEENPLENVSTGVELLWQELLERQGKD